MRIAPLPLALTLIALSCTGSDARLPGADAAPDRLARVEDLPTQELFGQAGDGMGRCVLGVGDLDLDGTDDVLVGGATGVALHHGTRVGLVVTPTQTWTTAGPACPVVGDFDGDGNSDLLLAVEGGAVDVYLGTSSGWPTERTTRVSGFIDTSDARVQAIGDIDGDGDVELQDASGSVWLGGTNGLSASRPGPAGGAFGDFDGDGDVDRVTVEDGAACTSGGTSHPRAELLFYRGSSAGLATEGLRIFEGRCTGTGTRIEIDLIHRIDAVGDLDGDGMVDLFAAISTDILEGSATVSAGRLEAALFAGSGSIPWLEQDRVDLTAGPTRSGVFARPAGDTNCDDAGELLVMGTESFAGCWLFEGDLAGGVSGDAQQLSPASLGGGCATAGDVDADGADDIVWGDQGADEGKGALRLSLGDGVECPVDRDVDGYEDDVDCDDRDKTVNPGATEGIADGKDQDCDGFELCYTDVDEDGFRGEETINSRDLDCDDLGEADTSVPPGDCNDLDPDVYPGAEELIADGIDQDCDGGELCWQDQDGDGWRPEDPVASEDADCEDAGEAVGTVPLGDCDDSDPGVNRGMVEEPADGIDQNCDGEEVCYVDADDDGHRTNTPVPSADGDCDDPGEALATEPDDDCDDADPTIHPGADDIPKDGIDQDCDGTDASGGCGCSSGGSGLGWAWLAVPWVLWMRRRKADPRE